MKKINLTSGIKEVAEGNLGNFSRKFPFIPCYVGSLQEKIAEGDSIHAGVCDKYISE